MRTCIKYSFVVVVTAFVFSCRVKIADTPQPALLGEKPYQLDLTNFSLQVPLFFKNKGSIERITSGGWFTPDSLKTTAALRFFIDEDRDSLAVIGNIYYNQLAMLTDKDSSLMAVWAQSDDFTTDTFFVSTLQLLQKQYGPPNFYCQEDNDWSTQYYMWETPDKLLQLQISVGDSNLNADSIEAEPPYYDSEFLVVKKNVAQKIRETIRDRTFSLAKYDTARLGCR